MEFEYELDECVEIIKDYFKQDKSFLHLFNGIERHREKIENGEELPCTCLKNEDSPYFRTITFLNRHRNCSDVELSSVVNIYLDHINKKFIKSE